MARRSNDIFAPPRQRRGIGCLAVTLLLIAALGGHLAARKVKMIATAFVTIAIMPLVPGLGLYRAMSAMEQGDMSLGAATGAHSMVLILMISLVYN